MPIKEDLGGDLLPSPPEILLNPWPKREDWIGRNLPREERERISEENRHRRADALAAKRAACPVFSVSVCNCDKASELSLPNGSMPFKVTLKYEGMPVNQPLHQHVVLHDPAVLSPKSVSRGHFKIYTSPTFERAIPFRPPQPTLRFPRNPDGRLVALPSTFRISAEEGWIELAPGDKISRDLTLDVSDSKDWQDSLEVGRTYYLRYDPYGVHPFCKAEIESSGWRFGTLADFGGKEVPTKENGLYIGIPLEPSESAVEFHVI